MKRFLLSILFFVGVVNFTSGQSEGDFRSRADGNWNVGSTWEEFVSGTWVNNANFPDGTENLIELQSGFSVTIAAGNTINISSSTTLINNGTFILETDGRSTGKLNVSGIFQANQGSIISGATTSKMTFLANSAYNHNFTTTEGAIPIATWSTDSNVNIVGFTSSNGPPTNLTQPFFNFTWNCPNMTTAFLNLGGNLNNVDGDLNISSTGTGSLSISDFASSTINIDGNFQVDGNSFVYFNLDLAVTYNIGNDFILSSSSSTYFAEDAPIDFNIVNNFIVNGSGTYDFGGELGGSGNTNIYVGGNFSQSSGTIQNSGTGTKTLHFQSGATSIFSRTGGTLNGVLNYSITGSTVVDAGSSEFVGDGDFNLGAGSKLITSNVAGISSSGVIQVAGTRTFNTGSTIEYNGTATQSLGNGFPPSGVNLIINNSGGGVDMNSDLTISSGRTLTFTAGTLNIGSSTLTLNGTVLTTSGGLSVTSLSNLAIGGTGAFGTLGFVGTSELQNFTLNRTSTGSVTLDGNLTVSGATQATDGFTQTAGDLLLNGNTLTLSGNIEQTGGTLVSNATSSLIINGAGALPAGLSVSGDINTITMDRASTTLNTASSNFTATNLNLFSGTLDGTAISIADGGTVERRTNGSLTNALTPVGSYNLIYNHSSAISTGAELPNSATAINNIEKRGTGVLTVLNDFTANGSLTFTNGEFNAGANTISLNGDLIANAGSTLDNSTITFDGTTNLTGSNNPTFGSITVNGTFNPASSLTVNGDITNNGVLNSSAGTLTINATSQLGGSNPITVNDFTIGTSGVVTASATQALEIDGNLTNNGSFNANSGTVIFGGNTTISGTVPTFASIQVDGIFNAPSTLNLSGGLTVNSGGTFNNNSGIVNMTGTGDIAGTGAFELYTLNVSGGVAIANENAAGVTIADALTVGAGTTIDFDGAAGSGEMTLKSTQTKDAYIAAVPSDATLSGILNVERAVYNVRSGDGKGFHMIGFPVTGATVGEVQASGFAVTGGFTGASTTGGKGDGNASILSYDQSAAGDFSNGYTAFPGSSGSSSSEFVNGTGYFMFTYAGDVPGTITTTGTVFTGSVTKPLPYTANGNIPVEDEGWHLIGNPYPSAINWDLVFTDNTEIDGWLWNPGAGAWEALTSGSNATIPQGQAFFLRSLPNGGAGGSITFDEEDKVSTFKSFYRTTEPDQIFKVGLDNGSYVDYTYIGLKEGATFDYNGVEDASRLFNNYETISTMTADGKVVKVNRVPFENVGTCGNSIFINLEQMVNSKQYTLRFEGVQNLSSKSIELYDHYLDQTLELSSSNSLQFTVNSDAASKGSTRFEIIINSNESLSQVAVESEDICPSENAVINLLQSDVFANYLVYSGEEIVASAEGTGTELSIEILNEFLGEANNDFEIKAFAAGCDTVKVGNASVQVSESLTLNNAVEGSTICKEANQASFSVATQVNASYDVLNDADTIQSFVGNGNIYQGFINSTELVEGLNQFTIAASKDGCQSGTLNQNLEIEVQDLVIDESITFSANNTCLKSSSDLSFSSQAGVEYQIFKGTKLLKSINGDGSEQIVTIPPSDLSLGNNKFTVIAQYGECAEFEFPQTIQIEVEENINTNLNLITENTCGDANTSVVIENAQAGKIYTLQSAGQKISSLTAETKGELVFNLNPSQLSVGLNELDIQIEGEACGAVLSANQAVLTIYEPINPDLEIQSPNVCTGDQVNIEITNPQAGKTYRLMDAGTMIATEKATNEDVLSFNLPSDLFGMGYHAMTINILDDKCGTLTANQIVEFELFEAGVISEVENQNVCKDESIVIDLSANVAMNSYQLYVGEDLITESSTSTLSLTPSETTTYTLTGIPENGCGVNTINFTIEVTDLATPGILVSNNVLESSVEGDSYQWYLNGEILEGERGKVLVAQESGEYSVEVSKANCTKISDAYTFSEEVLNANKALANAVHLYPNPVKDVLKIDMENIKEIEVTIFTLSGKFMDKMNLNSEKEQSIDMSKFSKGTYLLQLKSGKGTITKRIIKQ
ncbi:T9SS type A sorting domain-containing protein [Marivirga salinae]|uniref:T9SS type A sorting domain-containing protein n=1 Tax=Marivirga salinarum TaxID=3059078 RepID=A0AA51NAD8_9BACT|nr:T9SS type A sorting domain-containing protein [Marivirga sp. BDSF4-3]WMN11394.1 T9SS type A sorting domain-containing protein [Marivirga sp. BDSF4-3]